MKYLKRFNESLLDKIRNKTDKNLSDIKGKIGATNGDYKFCHNCGEKLEKIAGFCGECGEKQEMDNHTSRIDVVGDVFSISGTLTKNGYDLILRSPAKFLDGTKINLMIRDKCNDCTLPLNKEVKITGTTKNGEEPGFDNPIIVKSPENISVVKK